MKSSKSLMDQAIIELLAEIQVAERRLCEVCLGTTWEFRRHTIGFYAAGHDDDIKLCRTCKDACGTTMAYGWAGEFAEPGRMKFHLTLISDYGPLEKSVW